MLCLRAGVRRSSCRMIRATLDTSTSVAVLRSVPQLVPAGVGQVKSKRSISNFLKTTSLALHAGQLGIDCRYCHVGVERAASAVIPPTQICMNCHSNIRTQVSDPAHPGQMIDNPSLAPVLASWRTGRPVPWARVHDLPDYAYFNHSAHVNKGVGCVTCHGRVDQMEVVYQAQPLSMAWCISCHSNPGPQLRPLDKVMDLAWKPVPGSAKTLGKELVQQYHIRDSAYMVSCSTCHR